MPYEDVKNALKESIQNPFLSTKDEWVMGSDKYKLNKPQKRLLKDKEIYNHFDWNNVPIPIKTELSNIVNDIDN